MNENYIIFIAPLFIIPILYMLLVNLTLEKQWNPTTEQYGDIQYFRHIETKKLEITDIHIGLRSIDDCSFILKNEDNYDVYAKKLRISNEYQVGTEEFDDRLYIISDAAELNSIFRDDELQDLILSVFYDTTYNCVTQKIFLENGKLWLSLSAGSSVTQNNVDYISQTLLDRLKLINIKVMQKLVKLNIQNDKSKKIDNKYSAVSTSLFIYGALLFAGHSLFGIRHIDIDFEYSLCISILATFIIIGCLSLLAIRSIKKSSRTHLILSYIFILGSLGTLSITNFTIRYANAFFDVSPQISYNTSVIDKHIHHGKRHNSYLATIKTQENKTIDLPMSASDYYEIKINDPINITERVGFFKIHWISTYTKI